MGRKRERFFLPPVGVSLLLTAFAALCMTILALLALSSVQADGRLADAAVKATADYYAADVTAQEILARIRAGEPVSDAVELTTTIVDYEDRGDMICSYVVPISDTQELRAEIRLTEDGGYEILRWQAAAVELWDPDDSLELWDPDDSLEPWSEMEND